MVVADHKVVSIYYTLRNNDGEILDASARDDPLSYIHGTGSIIPGLEKQLTGKSAGHSFRASVGPAEAYGERSETLIKQLARAAFQGIEDIEEGMQFQAKSASGESVITVVKVDGDQITVDGNHPLAGETLNFEVEVKGVRDATAKELEHGHVHKDGDH